VEKTPKIVPKDSIIIGISIPGKIDQELLALFEDFMKHGHNCPLLLSNNENPMKYVTNQGEYDTITLPMPSLTPLEISFYLPCSEVINIDDLTPIEPEDMLS
jgi:hypothetical protein